MGDKSSAGNVDIDSLIQDEGAFCEALSYHSFPSLSLFDRKIALSKKSSLAAAKGRYGSAVYYAADRDGDYDFIRTLLNTGIVPIEQLNEAIKRSSSNGLLAILRIFVEHSGTKAITHGKNSEQILARCDHGFPNGPCWRYLM